MLAPGLEVSRGIVGANHVTLERHWSFSVGLTHSNSYQLRSTPLIAFSSLHESTRNIAREASVKESWKDLSNRDTPQEIVPSDQCQGCPKVIILAARFCNIHLIAFHQESARQRSAALLILLDLFGGKAVDERLIFSFSKVTS